MKLSASIDLAPHRDAALARIDMAVARRVPGGLVDVLREAKAAQASVILAGGPTHPTIAAEAALRGVTVEALCVDIVGKADAAQLVLLLIEGERQAARAQIRAAPDHHAILAAVAAIEGQN